jgi:hypothetical protein
MSNEWRITPSTIEAEMRRLVALLQRSTQSRSNNSPPNPPTDSQAESHQIELPIHPETRLSNAA